MLVLVIECAPPKLYGFCSSWALQVATGVYVANLPAKTREEIWNQVKAWSDAETRAVILWSSPSNEQGLAWAQIGEPRRRVVDYEGLLVSTWIPREAVDEPTPKETP